MKETKNWSILALLPIAGYYQGHSEGWKAGAGAAGAAFEKEYNLLKQRLHQIKQDIFGEETFLIFPDGWDEDYWVQLLMEFWHRQGEESLDAQALLIRFIDFCLEKFRSERDRLAETCHQLETIRKIVAMSPAARLKAEPGDLELTTDFLGVFGNPQKIKSVLAENQPDIPEQIKTSFKAMLTLYNEIKAAQAPSQGCNFLVLGKTGTGKSSLLNYLIRKKHFRAAAGKPVTKKGIGIDSFPTVIDNIKVTVYDSWGIETGAADEWLEILKQEKSKHGLQQKVSEWFHTIIYCIQAGGHRVEPIDTEIINSFLAEKYHVVVAITKADQSNKKNINILRAAILEGSPELSGDSIVAVCSVKDENWDGTIRKPFGKEELKEAILAGYVETIINQLPKRCIYLAKEEIRKFQEQTATEIDQLNFWDTDQLSFWDTEEYNSWLRGKCKTFLENFNSKTYPGIIDKEIRSALAINKNLARTINYQGNVISDPPENEWWENLLLGIGALLFGVAVAAVMIVRGVINKGKILPEDADKLKEALNKFVNDIGKKLDQDESHLRDSFRSIFAAHK